MFLVHGRPVFKLHGVTAQHKAVFGISDKETDQKLTSFKGGGESASLKMWKQPVLLLSLTLYEKQSNSTSNCLSA